jgi:hypothetical protein
MLLGGSNRQGRSLWLTVMVLATLGVATMPAAAAENARAGSGDDDDDVCLGRVQDLEAIVAATRKDLGLCQATSIAIETREEMLKAEIQAREAAHREELGAREQQIHSLEKEHGRLLIERDGLKETGATEQAKLLDTVLTLEKEKKALVNSLETVLTEKENLDKMVGDLHNQVMDAAAELDATLKEERTALTTEFETEKASWLQTLRGLEIELEAEKQSAQHKVQEQVGRAVQEAVEAAKRDTAQTVRQLLSEKLEWGNERTRLQQSAQQQDRELQKVKLELFDVRHELFAANEKLREPELKRKLRQKQMEEVIEYCRTAFTDAWAVVEPHYNQYVVPYAVEPATAAAKRIYEKCQAQYPVVREEAVAVWGVVSTWATEAATEVHKAVQPYWNVVLEQTAQPRAVAMKACQDLYANEHIQRGLQMHNHLQTVASARLSSAADLLLTYMLLENYDHTATSTTLHWYLVSAIRIVHEHPIHCVQHLEMGFAVYVVLALLLVVRSRRRRRQSVIKTKNLANKVKFE